MPRWPDFGRTRLSNDGRRREPMRAIRADQPPSAQVAGPRGTVYGSDDQDDDRSGLSVEQTDSAVGELWSPVKAGTSVARRVAVRPHEHAVPHSHPKMLCTTGPAHCSPPAPSLRSQVLVQGRTSTVRTMAPPATAMAPARICGAVRTMNPCVDAAAPGPVLRSQPPTGPGAGYTGDHRDWRARLQGGAGQ
jgi:hypothetical protein